MDRALLEEMFRKAVAAAQPSTAVAPNLPDPPKGRTIVIGAGKASARMAKALEEAWPGPLEGLVVTRYGYGTECKQIEIVEAAHPVPDAAGALAARRIMEKISGLSHNDLVIALISGGGSALLPAPAEGLTLEHEQAVNEALLASGAPIGVMNAVRNELSLIKGGRLAARAYPAKVVTLIVSDVPGDDPAIVASGPTVPMKTSREAVRRLLLAYRITLPAAVAELFKGERNLAPRPDDARLANNSVSIIASAAISLDAAAAMAKSRGLTPVVLSDAIEGEARDIGKMHAAIAREVRSRNRPFAKPVAILSGGETTVTLRGKGRGGRNAEFLLSFALAIEGIEGISALAADTDGIDGSETNAGAFADGNSVLAMRKLGIDPLGALADNDAYSAFQAVGGLFVTGPTGTNVNDFRAIIVR